MGQERASTAYPRVIRVLSASCQLVITGTLGLYIGGLLPSIHNSCSRRRCVNMDRSDLVCMLMQQHMNLQYQVLQHLSERRRRRRQQKRRVVRNIWVREWIARRPLLGLYDRLMVELRNEDHFPLLAFLGAIWSSVVGGLEAVLELVLELELDVACLESGARVVLPPGRAPPAEEARATRINPQTGRA